MRRGQASERLQARSTKAGTVNPGDTSIADNPRKPHETSPRSTKAGTVNPGDTRECPGALPDNRGALTLNEGRDR